jgi:hypothetical protein
VNCVLCGKPAGWFRRSHPECKLQHDVGRQEISELLFGYMRSDLEANQLGQRIRDTADRHRVSQVEVQSLLVAVYKKIVNEILETQTLSKEQEKNLLLYRSSSLCRTKNLVGH